VAGKRRDQKLPKDVRSDTADKMGGHLGHSASRGFAQGNVKVHMGQGRTSFRGDDSSAGGALGPEGTETDMNRPIADQIRDADDRHSRRPETLGLGGGDPGYTAEEDDERPTIAEQTGGRRS
jgi:hypothetical protein